MKRWAENLMGLDLEAERAEEERIHREAIADEEPEFYPIHRPREDESFDHYDRADEWMRTEARREEQEWLYGGKP